jgi:hypothetical protein
MSSNATTDHGHEVDDTPGEATILVSEFPPPPSYYKDASKLRPPEIPQEALSWGTQRAAAVAKRMRTEAECMRMRRDETNTILGGTAKEEDEDGEVVAVFGEICEDPNLVEPLDACEDPTAVRDQLKRLNIQAVQGFIKLVQDLVHRPVENK